MSYKIIIFIFFRILYNNIIFNFLINFINSINFMNSTISTN